MKFHNTFLPVLLFLLSSYTICAASNDTTAIGLNLSAPQKVSLPISYFILDSFPGTSICLEPGLTGQKVSLMHGFQTFPILTNYRISSLYMTRDAFYARKNHLYLGGEIGTILGNYTVSIGAYANLNKANNGARYFISAAIGVWSFKNFIKEATPP